MQLFSYSKLNRKIIMNSKKIGFILTEIVLFISFFSFSGFGKAKVSDQDNISINSSSVAKIFQNPGISNSNSSINIISLKTGSPIYQFNITKPLLPASNLKLITSAASLALLKPEHKFKTVIYGDAFVTGGKLNGNLYLKGYGDPDLTTERLWRMVRKLKNTGIKEITGDLIADESFFDSKEISEVFGTPALEEIICQELERFKIPFKQEYCIYKNRKILYRLDIAIFCSNGKIAVECDSEKWHFLRKQKIKDRKRDKYLKKMGWKVLRFTGNEITSNPAKCVEKIYLHYKFLNSKIQ